ncbi:YihY/virulence factor BrkB family protein [Rhodobacteraceae bacterium CCMM004]|nr:YihY/virulence factor BrkB family protein [Rhodobacteraceae bacterium CCMM004]
MNAGRTGGLHPGLSRRDWWRAVRAVFVRMDERNLGLISAGVAFYGMLALFPTVGAIIAVWGTFADPVVVEGQIALLTNLAPPDALAMIEDQVAQILAARETNLGWATLISTGIALWVARAGVAALIRGLNSINGERNRSGIRHMIAAFGVTFLLIGVALVSLASVVVLPIVLAFLPLGYFTGLALSSVRWVVAISVVLAGLGVVYRFGPNRRHARAAWITPGAIVAVVIWAAASWGFTYYIANFGNYNEIYGALGAVIALMMWLYISAFVVLLGAVLNVELELRTVSDSTVGPAKPMGQRGAVPADSLAHDATAREQYPDAPTMSESEKAETL